MSEDLQDKKMNSAGKLLQRRRYDLGITIEEASEDTKIQKKYLEMIERDQYDEFESEIFLKGFLKSYSRYLGLKQDKILAIYRRSNPESKNNAPKNSNTPQLKEKKSLSARRITEILLASFVILVGTYFAYQLYNFQKVPTLEVKQPENNTSTTEKIIDISGKTDPNTIVTINDVSTKINENNEFNDSISLNEGINTITIRAVRKNNESKETLEVLTITKEVAEIIEEATPDPEPEKPTIQDKFTLKIEGGDAWILLIIDGKQELGFIVQNGFEQTYTVKESLELTSGRLDTTKVFLNNNSEATPLNISSGVGVLSCAMVNDQLTCDNTE